MEIDGKLTNKEGWKTPNITISATVKPRLWSDAKEFGISWSEALDFGIRFLLAERFLGDYPENNLSKKIERLSILLEEHTKETENIVEEAQEEMNKILEAKPDDRT